MAIHPPCCPDPPNGNQVLRSSGSGSRPAPLTGSHRRSWSDSSTTVLRQFRRHQWPRSPSTSASAKSNVPCHLKIKSNIVEAAVMAVFTRAALIIARALAAETTVSGKLAA